MYMFYNIYIYIYIYNIQMLGSELRMFLVMEHRVLK